MTKDTYTLEYPFDWDGQTQTEVQYTPAKGIHLRSAAMDANTPADMDLGLIAACCDMPIEAIDEMYIQDLEALLALVKTPKKPSPTPPKDT